MVPVTGYFTQACESRDPSVQLTAVVVIMSRELVLTAKTCEVTGATHRSGTNESTSCPSMGFLLADAVCSRTVH